MPQQPLFGDSTSAASSPTRRHFLGGVAATAASSLAASRAFGAVHTGASGQLRIGLVGAGGRGKGAVSDAFSAGPDAVLVAMCDAFADNVDSAHKELSERFPDRVKVAPELKLSGFDAYKAVIESDCDMVILATPPGFRPLHFKAAIDAGKHVFMEKPVAVDAPGVRQVMETATLAKEKGLGVGVGLQRRHDDLYIATIEKIWDGALGDSIPLMRVYWNGGLLWTRPRQPGQTEMEYQMRNWYYFNWVCGDHIVEQHIHNLDVGNWIKQGHPVKANGMGGREVRTGKEHGQIFDHHAVEFTYADGSTMLSQCRHMDGCWSSVSEHAHGPKGTCNVSSGLFYDNSGKAVDRLRKKGENPYVQEHIDLQRSIKEGSPLAEGEDGAIATMTSILGRMATYSGKVVEWDAALASVDSLAPAVYSFDAPPPVVPDAEGRYPVPVPGVTPPFTAASAEEVAKS